MKLNEIMSYAGGKKWEIFQAFATQNLAAEEKRRETNNDYWFCGGIDLL